MISTRSILLGLAGAALVATGALAQDVNPAVKARQAHMTLYSHHLGLLGGMARGNIDYNADAASASAASLAALTKLDQSRYWAPGTDSESIEGTRALPALWENIPRAMEIGGNLSAAADTLAGEAGNGLEALQAALGPVGQACGACHEAFRVPNN